MLTARRCVDTWDRAGAFIADSAERGSPASSKSHWNAAHASDQGSHSAGLPRFDDALRNALILHRRYWRDFESNPGERQANDPQGCIALGPFAWATLRHHRGLAVTSTSVTYRRVIESRQHGSSGPA
jgi:hypothetical protein